MIHQIHETGTRLLRLRQKLAARTGVPGYEKNCEVIQAEIARLESTTLSTPKQTAPAATVQSGDNI